MALSISGTIRHGSQSQHNPTLTLFERGTQLFVLRYLLRNTATQEPKERIMQFLMHSGHIWRCSKGKPNIVIFQSRQILHTSIGENTRKNTLAALALKEDTIAKPDGLAMVS